MRRGIGGWAGKATALLSILLAIQGLGGAQLAGLSAAASCLGARNVLRYRLMALAS